MATKTDGTIRKRGGEEVIQGECNCGAVVIELKKELFPPFSALCHCRNCRASSGGLPSVNFSLPTTEVKIIKGKENIKTYRDTETKSGNVTGRSFCGVCGTAITSIVEEKPEIAFVKGGLFVKNGVGIPKVGVEVFWGSREGWEVVHEGAKVIE